MKRHPDLLQLSREHYGALKLARDARRAAESAEPGAVAAVAQVVMQAFATELDPHFCLEEQGILVLLAQTGQHELVARTLADHVELRRLAKVLATPDSDTLLRFGELLAAHVRFEEREVFEAAQARLGFQPNPIQSALHHEQRRQDPDPSRRASTPAAARLSADPGGI